MSAPPTAAEAATRLYQAMVALASVDPGLGAFVEEAERQKWMAMDGGYFEAASLFDAMQDFARVVVDDLAEQGGITL